MQARSHLNMTEKPLAALVATKTTVEASMLDCHMNARWTSVPTELQSRFSYHRALNLFLLASTGSFVTNTE